VGRRKQDHFINDQDILRKRFNWFYCQI